jgi:hypothetical protein
MNVDLFVHQKFADGNGIDGSKLTIQFDKRAEARGG